MVGDPRKHPTEVIKGSRLENACKKKDAGNWGLITLESSGKCVETKFERGWGKGCGGGGRREAAQVFV